MNAVDTPISETGRERVYLDFYNLAEAPFSITPDPEFLFFSDTHQNAINKILYGIKSRMGFLLLVGEVGTGKTTICRSLLDSLTNKAETVYIINPSLSGTELIASILDDLGIDYQENASKKELINTLNQFLLSTTNGKPVVIIIDDAQTMNIDALEDMRLLSNLETDKDKLLQILLVGQQELLNQLSQPEIRQLKQRVAITCRLKYLSRAEVDGYIARRLFVSGDKGHIRFNPNAIDLIYSVSNGIPRLINRICDYTLTAGYVSDAYDIKREHVKKAIRELKDLDLDETLFVKEGNRKLKWLWFSGLSLLIGAFIIGILWYRLPFHLIPTKKHSPPQPKANNSETIQAYKIEASQLADTVKNQVVATTTGIDATDIVKENADQTPVGKSEAVPDSSTDVFIIRVASFRTIERAEKAVALLKERNIHAYYKLVDLGSRGKWYGLYTGSFESKDKAQKFKDDHALHDAVIELRRIK